MLPLIISACMTFEYMLAEVIKYWHKVTTPDPTVQGTTSADTAAGLLQDLLRCLLDAVLVPGPHTS